MEGRESYTQASGAAARKTSSLKTWIIYKQTINTGGIDGLWRGGLGNLVTTQPFYYKKRKFKQWTSYWQVSYVHKYFKHDLESAVEAWKHSGHWSTGNACYKPIRYWMYGSHEIVVAKMKVTKQQVIRELWAHTGTSFLEGFIFLQHSNKS